MGKMKGMTNQFGWLQAPAIKLIVRKELRHTLQPSEFATPSERSSHKRLSSEQNALG